MSVSGISGSLFNAGVQTSPSNLQQFQKEFKQLGQDLQSGNLSAAQSDFATLRNLAPQSSSTTLAQGDNPIAQAFSQLGKDLASGNLSAVQQDYAKLQQAIQNRASHLHHHRHEGGEVEASVINHSFRQLGQALQSGNLSSARQAYGTLLQEFQQSGESGAQPAQPSLSSAAISVSLSA